MSHKIVRFTASWCQPCKALAMNLDKANLEVPIEVVDVDAMATVAEAFGIRAVPVLVLLEGDKEVARSVGVKTVDQLKSWVMANT